MNPHVEQALDLLNKAISGQYSVASGQKQATSHKPLPTNHCPLATYQVPFDFPKDWPEAAQAPFAAFHAARLAMQQRMDDSIARNAAQETLFDQPKVDRKKVRVTGPFTVEAVPFPTVVGSEQWSVASGQATEHEPLAPNHYPQRSGESARQHQWIAELLATGLRGKGGQKIEVEVVSGLWLVDRKNEVLIPYGLFKELSGLDRLEEVLELGGDGLSSDQRVPKGRNLRAHQSNATGGDFDSLQHRGRAIEELNQRVSILLGNSERITGGTGNPDYLGATVGLSDTQSERGSTEIFSGNWNATQRAYALAKIKALTSDQLPLATDHYSQASVHGFDYFDIGKGEIRSGGRNNIAVWLLDTDYNGRSLLPTQVFFPMAGEKDGWSRLAKNLKAVLDESRIDAYHGTVSLPFKAGKYRRVAVKIVDDRGIESLVVKQLAVDSG